MTTASKCYSFLTAAVVAAPAADGSLRSKTFPVHAGSGSHLFTGDAPHAEKAARKPAADTQQAEEAKASAASAEVAVMLRLQRPVELSANVIAAGAAARRPRTGSQ